MTPSESQVAWEAKSIDDFRHAMEDLLVSVGFLPGISVPSGTVLVGFAQGRDYATVQAVTHQLLLSHGFREAAARVYEETPC